VVFSGPLAQWYPLRRWGLGVIAAAALTCAAPVESRQPALEPAPVALAQLPVEAQAVHRLIRSGGPFRYARDGALFGNRERALPRQARGFYREYTVATPGSRDRGARRIVCGGPEPKAPVACFYTADHYNSFRRISP
jgi:ribonuclease T1